MEISSKQFFLTLFFLVFHTLTFAQKPQPGGVNGTKLWYVTQKTGNGYTLKDTSGNQWRNYGSNTSININYHPAFLVEQNTMNFENFPFNQYTVAGIFYPNQVSASSQFFRFASSDSVAILRSNRIEAKNNHKKLSFGVPAERTTLNLTAPATKLENAMKTAVYHQSSRKVYNSIWGEDKNTSFISNFSGYLPELIVYNRVLSPLERCKVETYLAIKYGTTLDTSYIGSDARTLWNRTDPILRKFHHRVCAIGKERLAAIWQPISASTYEEEVSSFSYGADEKRLGGLRFIPSEENYGLFRSVTIGYMDTAMSGVKEGEFLFWGDDSLSIKSSDYYTIPSGNYQNLKVVRRKWVMYNPDGAKNSTKVVVANKLYNSTTLFGNLYKKYDYQHFRFVLIKIDNSKPDNIDMKILCSYFGREYENNKYHFNTKSIVWDSIYWSNRSGYNYFTFGKVPLLNFLRIGKNINSLEKLDFPFDPDNVVGTHTSFDTVTLKYTPANPRTFVFDVNEGVKPMIPPTLYIKLASGALQPVPNAFNENGNINDTTLVESTLIGADTSEIAAPVPRKPGSTKQFISRIRDNNNPEQKPRPVRYVATFPRTNAIYVVEVSDKVGQKTTIPVKIILSN